MASACPPVPGIFELYNEIESREECISYLRSHSLLRQTANCKKCHKKMQLVTRPASQSQDLEGYKCNACNTTLTIRDGSIFKVSNTVSQYEWGCK